MSHPSNHIDPSSVKELFRYKTPTPDTVPRYNAVTAAASAFAEALLANAPACDFTKQAIQHVVLARMLANAAIANEPAAEFDPKEQ